MSINLWHRATSGVRERYRRTALAQYSAGLHVDCPDCSVETSDLAIPSPRRAVASPTAASQHVAER